ncbi:hypothetical protein A2164_01665 [Candidatus Curtissbacteria bacterium RBG_13_35_7]|uniref:Uncharacterized protein n=1 Tax=Candidatus Curtissbacteria bacterium RBG_13_35_7 TaxID=1797705 RepID=A0A1F5G035_9BACT|nr:MAG: hypothetical protein A2164_01665 [Candidatus Curtissbacteria bacterium RBG_13_35_7]
MIHKFCKNHLDELYDVIKAGKISDIEKIEHKLTHIEECVACAYALKAKGEAKEVLAQYLKSRGFKVEVPISEKEDEKTISIHNFIHHILMIITCEINNLVWLFTGIVITVSGFTVYNFAYLSTFKLVVGLPLILIGISLILMKGYEVILVIVDIKRLKEICKYCKR